MALTPQEQGRVFRYLEPKYRKAYEEGQLSDDDLREWAVAAGVLGADFSGVESEAQSTATPRSLDASIEQEPNLNPIAGLLSSGVITPERIAGVAAIAGDESARTAITESARGGLAGLGSAMLALQQTHGAPDGVVMYDPLGVPVYGDTSLRDSARGAARQSLQATQEDAQSAGQAALSRVPSGVAYESVETLSDIASTPESFLSTLGPFGSILAAGGQYARNLDQAQVSGLEGGKDVLYASIKSSPAALEFVPGALAKPIKRNVDDLTNSLFANVLKRAGAEGTTETLQSAAEMGIDKALAEYSDDEQIRQLAQSNLPQSTAEFWDNLWRSLKAGGVAGGALSIPGETFRAVQDAGFRAGSLSRAREETRIRTLEGEARRQEAARAPAQPDMFETPQDLPSQEDFQADRQRALEEEAAYVIRNRQQRAEALQGNTEERLNNLRARVDTARDSVFTLQDQIEAGDTSPATLSAAAAAQRELARSEQLLSNAQANVPVAPVVPERTAPATTVEPVQEELSLREPAAPVTEPAKPTRRTRNKKAAAPATEEATVDPATTIADMRARLRAQQSEGTTGVTADRVFDEFEADVASRESGRVAGLLADRNLEIVNTQSDLPQGDLLPQGKGFYDPAAGKTILVADKLDPENIKGDVMSVLAHEVKHAADRGGFTPTRGSLKNIIGEKNNERVVSQIENLAKQNTPMGRATNEMLQTIRANYDKSTWNEEIPANFINLAMAERTGPGRALVSAIRTRYKEFTGKNDLNLNDVKYLANELTREAAQTGERFRGQAEGAGAPLPMIVGPRHPRFEELREQGRTYTGKDGNERAVLTDVGSAVQVDPLAERILSAGRDTPIPIERIFRHEELFSAYPELRDINIIVDPNVEDMGGYYQEDTKTMALSRAHIAGLLQGDRGKAAVRGTILHELQHAVQAIEGNSRGGSPDQFLSNSDRIILRQYDKANMDLLDTIQPLVQNPGSMAGLEQETVNELRSIGDVFSSAIDDNVVNEVIAALEQDGSRFATNKIKEIRKLDNKAKELLPEVEARRAASERKYYNLYGEIEAYWTERARNLTQDQLPIDPERELGPRTFRGSGVQRSDEVLLNFPASGVTPLAQQIAQTDQTFTWAEDYFKDETKARNFTQWFRNSKVVDESGNPRVMYHGTRADAEFTTFIPGENEAGIHVGTPAQANDPAFMGAIYTTDPEKNSLSRRDDWRSGLRPRVIPLFVRIENPLRLEQDIFGMDSASNLLDTVIEAARNDGAPVDVIQNAQKYWNLIGRDPEDITFDDVRGMAQQLGYDGFVYRNENEGVVREYTTDESSRLFNPTAAPQAEDSYVVFNSNQLKSATANSGAFSNAQLNILAQQTVPPRTIKIDGDVQQQNKVKRAAKRLLVPSGGFGSELNEILRHANNLPASLAIEGTHLGNALLDAIKENRVKYLDTYTEEQLRDAINERVEAIDKLPTRSQRVSALNALDREFPGVGPAINAMREFKLSLTDELLALRLRDPSPMSEKEVATYEKMVQNAERYTTRAYLATYNEEIGQEYSKNLMKQYNKDPDSEQGKIVTDAINYLVDNELLIPDEATLAKLPMPQLRRMYDAYYGDVDSFKGAGNRQVFVDKLMAIDPQSREELEVKAVEIVRDMLGLNDTKGRIAKAFTPSLRQNRTILETRTDMPEPLRKLMGEITDPFLRESISLHRMMNLVAKTKALTEIFEAGKDNGWWSDKRTPTHREQLNNISYGPLDKKWITQDLSDAITGMVFNAGQIDAALGDMVRNPDAIAKAVAGATLPAMHKIMGIQKTWNVVASGMNMMYNLAGAAVVGAPTQGIYNPAAIVRAMRDTAGTLMLEVTDRYTTEKQVAMASELVRAGVTDSATMGEFRSQAYQAILKEIRKISPDTKNPGVALANAVWRGVTAQGNTANALRQAYAFMDVWTKVATYQNRKQFLTDFNKAEGKGWTSEQIQRRAGYEAAGTNISYERAIPLAKIIERNVPVAMFLTYFTEVPRALSMSYLQAVRDFNMARDASTPEGKRMAYSMAMKRFTGTAAATAGIVLATMAALDSEDEDEQKKRSLDAPWMRNQVLIPVGQDKNGNIAYVSLNRFDPWGPLNETIVELARAPEGQLAETAAAAIIEKFVGSKGVLAVTKTLVDAVVQGAAHATGTVPPDWKWLRRDKSTILERNYPKAYEMIRQSVSAGDIGENSVQLFEDLFLPAPAATMADEDRAVSGNAGAALQWTGGKAYIRDPDKSLAFRAMDYGDLQSHLKTELKDIMASSKYADPADTADALADIIGRERQEFNRLREAYVGHLVFDARNHRTAADALGERNKKLASQLRTGRFQSQVLTERALDTWYKNALKETEDKKELRTRYNAIRKIMIESRKSE